jgi:hypothetical protein
MCRDTRKTISFQEENKGKASGPHLLRRRRLFAHASQGRHPIIPLFHYSIIPVVSEANQVPKGGISMDDIELFKDVINWAYHHCRDLWKEYKFSTAIEKRQHIARKILIEKVKKEPDTELLISPALKEKILKKEGVDLKRINYEYQEKKESSKVKQETKIYIQEPGEDIDIDGDEIINVDLSDQLKREWNKFKWYSMPSIAKKLGKHRKTVKTVIYWRDFGTKINGEHIRLKMIKRPFQWYAKGKWIIEFFLKTNANLDMDET